MSECFLPRPYQKLIVRYIIDHPRCAIFASMGLGKTTATLAALDIIRLVDKSPVLIVAPLRVAKTVWSDEIEKWTIFNHLTISKILGDPVQRKHAISRRADIYITNYENIVWLVDYFGSKWPYKIIVADESSKLKGLRARQGTKRARALAKIAHTKVERFIQLTGTPASNGLQDLFSCGWFIDKGARLGNTFTAFSQRWFRPTWDGFGLIPLSHAQTEIQQRLSDVCLSIDAKDYFDLKEPIVNKIYVDLPLSAMKIYKEMEKELYVEIAKQQVEAFNAASMTIKCLQIAAGALYVEGSNDKWEIIHDEKIAALESVIEEAAGAPVLVAYNFRSDLSRLMRAFPRGRVLDQNEKTVKEWNEGKIPILFAHPASAGHGLNLQHGSNIIAFFNISWNLEEHLQVIQRLGPVRQMQSGYNRPVFIHYILARDTIDEQVMERLQTKRKIQDILLDAMKARQ